MVNDAVLAKTPGYLNLANETVYNVLSIPVAVFTEETAKSNWYFVRTAAETIKETFGIRAVYVTTTDIPFSEFYPLMNSFFEAMRLIQKALPIGDKDIGLQGRLSLQIGGGDPFAPCSFDTRMIAIVIKPADLVPQHFGTVVSQIIRAWVNAFDRILPVIIAEQGSHRQIRLGMYTAGIANVRDYIVMDKLDVRAPAWLTYEAANYLSCAGLSETTDHEDYMIMDGFQSYLMIWIRQRLLALGEPDVFYADLSHYCKSYHCAGILTSFNELLSDIFNFVLIPTSTFRSLELADFPHTRNVQQQISARKVYHRVSPFAALN